MLSAIVALPAACDLLASYAAAPLAAARNRAPGFQASFGVRKWDEDGRGWQKVDEQRRSIGVADEADEVIDAPLTFHVAAPPPLPKPRPRPAERAAARVGVFKAAPPLPAVIRAAQRTGGGAAAGSDDESAVCFAPRQRVAPPPPMDSRSDPRSRSPDNDVL